MSMNILLADDHAMLRSGLHRIIADSYPEAIIGEVGTCEGLSAQLKEKTWSVLVLDIALGDRNSLDLVPELIRSQPQMKIIVLSMYSEHQFVIRAIRAGVSAYVTKDRAPEDLIRAIDSVLKGKRYLSENIARQLADHVAMNDLKSGEPHEHLSSREHEVFLLLASARTVSEIATRLHLSVKTVSTYRTRILEKMGMNSNAELMQYALRSGLTQ